MEQNNNTTKERGGKQLNYEERQKLVLKGLLQMQVNCRQQPLSLREICLFE